MHKNYGAAVAKGSHRIIFGTIRKENTEILQEKTKRIIPVFGDTFVSAKGYALSPSSSRKLLANMRINLRRQTEKLATQLNIEYIFERPEEKYYYKSLSLARKNVEKVKNKFKIIIIKIRFI